MLDIPTMIESILSPQDKQKIEDRINAFVDKFEDVTRNVCNYYVDLGFDDFDSHEILLKQIVHLQHQVKAKIFSSLPAFIEFNDDDQAKEHRLAFYRSISADLVETIFHSLIVLNFHANKIEDEETSKKLIDNLTDIISNSLKIATIHGIDVKSMLNSYVSMKSQSFMSLEQATKQIAYVVDNFKKMDSRPLESVIISKLHVTKNKYVISIVCYEKEIDCEVRFPYNPLGFDSQIFNLIAPDVMLLDFEEKIKNGVIPLRLANIKNETNKKLN